MKFKASTLHKIGRPLVNYVYKNPKKNIPKVLKIGKAITGNLFPETTWTAPLDVITNPQNTWNDYVYRIIEETDKELLTNMLLTFAIDAGYIGTSTLRENRDKLKCNIPWIILMDPTSACNLKCKGCWAAEYGHHSNLTLDEMRKIVTEAKALGTHFFMFTGGEPLVRKKDILTITNENKDCIFLAFTNGTLIDDEFCEELKKSGNFALALSIEGTEETTDFRRGEGVYQKVVDAMALLKKHKCIFGTSVCYTSKNYDAVTSDKFYDMEIEAGAKFALYFHYMPIGSDADTSLLLTPEQREHVYRTIRKKRRARNGKPIFVMDFQNDGEFVGGCIAGGRNYFHINSEGDAEPCVFIHYSDSNIREKSILECLRSPLFKQYYKGQPFNDNMLRPCPMLENPQALRHIIDVTGAKSTNLTCPESADELCSKCDLYAKEWAPMAKQIWEEQERFHPFTQYYRDTDEAKNEQ
ncbi:radical SAM protein [uncultured Eubacterium sp.]|uniref:radical SAM protein n=1 Tax=uncultured Eubacterium sp. TaxID=165185 RepID=UPI0026301CDC|nr:radical SAM protein [uncultured Eubacterium sp.]